jgi:hypothetical protein
MADYIKKYVDRVADVPAQLHRLFALIRDLDERVAMLQDELESKCRQQVQRAAQRSEQQLTKRQKTQASEEDVALAAEIDTGMQKIVSLSEEKVGAHQGGGGGMTLVVACAMPGLACVAGAHGRASRCSSPGRPRRCWLHGRRCSCDRAPRPCPALPPRLHPADQDSVPGV